MPIIIGKPGSKGIAIGPGAVAVGAGGVIVNGKNSGNICITGNNNSVQKPTDGRNIIVEGDNNKINGKNYQSTGERDERRIAR